MKRLLWMVPLLTVFFYAPVATGDEVKLSDPNGFDESETAEVPKYVPLYKPDPVFELKPNTELKPIAEQEPVAVQQPVAQRESVPKPEPDSRPEPESIVIPEPVPIPEPVLIPESVPEPEPAYEYDDSTWSENLNPVDDGTAGWDSACENCCETSVCRPKLFQRDRLFGGIEYLNWWSKGQDLPPLVAAGDGLPPNPILFGAGRVGDDYQAAVRSTSGYWFDDCKTSAFVMRSYVAEGSDSRFAIQSDGSPAFAIPFINDGSNPALAGQPDSFVLADAGLLQPGTTAGAIAEASNEIFGGDAFIRKLYRKGCGYRVDWLAGFQYSGIDDDVMLATSTNRTTGNTFATFDSFDAENRYYAGELGMIIDIVRGRLTIQLMSKIGLGGMIQEMSIQGANSVNGTVTGGGIFAQDQSASGGPTFNIWNYQQDEFAYSPEVGVKGIICLRKCLDLTVGYNFVYWSDVLLAGENMDTRLNRDVFFDGPFIPGGGSNPSFDFNETDYWVHTLDLGLLYRY